MEKLIALLFHSRDVAHRAHLMTKGNPGDFAMHMATGEFYDSIIDLADTLAETWIGRNGAMPDIEFMGNTDSGNIAELLAAHLEVIKELRYSVLDKEDTVIQNEMDEIEKQYSRTLFKLNTLK